MDLTDRKAAGEHVDSKNIKKHKNDVFRLTELIDPTAKVVAPQGVYADIQEFVLRMKNENVDIKQLGLVGRTKEKILEELKAMYEGTPDIEEFVVLPRNVFFEIVRDTNKATKNLAEIIDFSEHIAILDEE